MVLFRNFASIDTCFRSLENGLKELAQSGFISILDHNTETFHLHNEPQRAHAVLRLFLVAELRTIGSRVGVAGAQKKSRADVLQCLCATVTTTLQKQQSKITFTTSESSTRSGASTLEKVIRSILQPPKSALSKSGSGGKQKSLLSLWGASKSASDGKMEDLRQQQEQQQQQQQQPVQDGIVVLGDAVCAAFDRANFLFFLNQSDYRAMSLVGCGQVRYPSYTANRHTVFRTRDELDKYLLASHAVDFALNFIGIDVQSYGGDEIPIPGRSILLLEQGTDASGTMHTLIELAIVDLLDQGLIDPSRDPFASCDETGDLVDEFDQLGSLSEVLNVLKSAQSMDWSSFLQSLISRNSDRLSPFEPRSVFDAPPMRDEDVVDPFSASTNLSQDHLVYLRRFRAEYAQLYLLRMGVDVCEKERNYDRAILILRVLLR
jgi:hypothetical protein